MTDSLDQTFERLAKEFLARHPEIQHEWREIKSLFQGKRTDLICGTGSPHEVFVSLQGYRIAVGRTAGDHQDFEDFGRGLSDEAVAQEALGRFVEVLRECGHIQNAP